MILEQFYLQCLSHASYIVADESTRVAAIVDPRRDIEQYVTFAAEHGLEIQYVILTHFHADFVAGHLELQARTGARIMLGAKASILQSMGWRNLMDLAGGYGAWEAYRSSTTPC